MDYEKKYKAALGRAKELIAKWSGKNKDFYVEDYSYIFPELAESEDERIRKEIHDFILNLDGSLLSEGHEKRWLAWLEKQKEPKPDIELIQRSWYMEGYHDREFGKEPKWILKTGEGGPKHELNPRYGQPLAEQQPAQEQKPVEWDEYTETNLDRALMIIKKAKGNLQGYQSDDGIYECDKAIECIEHILYRGVNIESIEDSVKFEEGFKTGREIGFREGVESVKPVEKQDYSGLTDFERAIHRGFLCAGVENVPVGIIKETAKECLAHLPVGWHREDEQNLNVCLSYIKDEALRRWLLDVIHSKYDKPVEWSERHIADVFEKVGLAKIVREQGNDTLTNAVQSAMIELSKVENTEWSEEDKKQIAQIERIVKNAGCAKMLQDKIHNWLKSLRPQQKQEWKRYIWMYNMKFTEDALIIYEDNRECEFVKKGNKPRRNVNGTYVPIKDIYPQPHWKPSEEQMTMLRAVLNDPNNAGAESCQLALSGLYEQLKKL